MAYIGNEPSVNFTSFAKQDITGDGTANYTLTYAVANANEIEVFVNNVRQEPSIAYTVSGTALSMTGNVASTDDFYVIYLGKALQTTTPPDGSVTSAKISYPLTTFSSTGIDDNATSTAITVDSSQNVGIGNASPSAKLDAGGHIRVTGGNDCDIEFQSGSARRKFIGGDGNELELGTFSSNNTSRDVHLRIESSGRLLVGTSSSIAGSNAVIHINADAVGTGAGSIISECSGTGTVYHVHFRNGNGGVGGINTNGTSTSYVTSSDYRLKENVTADWDATTRLKQLNPVRFNFIADADTTVDGFLAHEVQSVVPEAITGTHNEVDADGNAVMQGIDQSKIVPLLVKTIQELEARITALENS